METTTNLGLKKPAETEFYDVNDFNENADKIDAAVSQLETAIAARAMGVYNEGFIGGLNATLLSTGGAAVGAGAKASKGLAGGKNASAAEGAAIGSEASASHGVAAGRNARTLHGAALGDGAQTVDAEGNPITAVQLGAGTNSDPNTFQVFSYQMMDEDGQIPEARLTSAVGGKVKLPESVFVIYAYGDGIFYEDPTVSFPQLLLQVNTTYGPAQFGTGHGRDSVSVGGDGTIKLKIRLYLNDDGKLCWDEYYKDAGIDDSDRNTLAILDLGNVTINYWPGEDSSWEIEYEADKETEEAFEDEKQYIHSEALNALALRMQKLKTHFAGYSDTPVQIGTWIDGSPVYRRAFQQTFNGNSVQVFLQNADDYQNVVILNARCLLINSTNDNFVWTTYDVGGGGSTSVYVEFAESSKPSGTTIAYGYVDYIIES